MLASLSLAVVVDAVIVIAIVVTVVGNSGSPYITVAFTAASDALCN